MWKVELRICVEKKAGVKPWTESLKSKAKLRFLFSRQQGTFEGF